MRYGSCLYMTHQHRTSSLYMQPLNNSMSIGGSRRMRLRADSHYTSRFRSVAERHRSANLSHVYLNGDVHTDRNVSVPFRRRRRARMFDGTERVRTGLNLLDSVNVNIPTSRPVRFECLLATSAAWFFFGNG